MAQEKNLRMRLTDGMDELIKKNAEQKGVTISEYIRQLVIADSNAEDVKEMLMK